MLEIVDRGLLSVGEDVAVDEANMVRFLLHFDNGDFFDWSPKLSDDSYYISYSWQ